MAKKQRRKPTTRKSGPKTRAAAKPAASKARKRARSKAAKLAAPKRATVAQKTPERTKKAPAKPKRTAPSRVATLIDLSRVWEDLGILRPIEFRVTFARPDDLLVCDFIFDNLRLDQGKLVRKVVTATATLIVEFPPQSFGEQAFLDATGPDVPNPIPPGEKFKESGTAAGASSKNVPVSNAESFGSSLPFARIRMAGRSRIAFTMPQNEKDLPFTLDAILDAARRWPMRLDSSAAPEPPARGLGVLDDVFKDQTFFNKTWLASVTTSGDWNRAGEALFGALGAQLEGPIIAASSNIAAQAIKAINSGKKVGL